MTRTGWNGASGSVDEPESGLSCKLKLRCLNGRKRKEG